MKDKFSYARGPKRADLHPTPPGHPALCGKHVLDLVRQFQTSVLPTLKGQKQEASRLRRIDAEFGSVLVTIPQQRWPASIRLLPDPQQCFSSRGVNFDPVSKYLKTSIQKVRWRREYDQAIAPYLPRPLGRSTPTQNT